MRLHLQHLSLNNDEAMEGRRSLNARFPEGSLYLGLVPNYGPFEGTGAYYYRALKGTRI